jgi:hypothetical protein
LTGFFSRRSARQASGQLRAAAVAPVRVAGYPRHLAIAGSPGRRAILQRVINARASPKVLSLKPVTLRLIRLLQRNKNAIQKTRFVSDAASIGSDAHRH